MKPKIYAYSPFIKFLGGGEKYFANILKIIQEIMSVTLICHEEDIKYLKQLQKLFNVDLSKISVVPAKLKSEADIQQIIPPDSVFWQVSNGVPLFVNCKKRILHHQIIFPELNALEVAERFPEHDKKTINLEIKNRFLAQDNIFFPSNFIKQFMTDHWLLRPERCSKIYPFVSDIFFKQPEFNKKQVKIVSVGRFEPIKKQKAQIELFIKIQPSLPNNCRLVLIGSNKTPLSAQLEKMACNYPIEIKYALSEKELLKEYSSASIYWSTTGLGEQDVYEKHNVESFGLAIAEAMAAGCVPVAIKAGGVSEIINSGQNGFLVSNIEELGLASKNLLTSPHQLQNMSEKAHKSVKFFSEEMFRQKIEKLFGN